jgi:N-acetylglucosamine-6-phosphate deacetylase
MTPVGPVAHAEVVMEGATITDVRPATGAVPDVVLVPGFVDLQVNGIGTVDVAVATEEQWTTIDEALLAQGVTTWCPTIVTAPLDALETSLDAIATAAARPPGARPEIAGAHLEGPFLGVLGAHRAEFVRGDVDGHWLESLGDRIRILTLAPELPGALDAIAALSAQGVLVSLGHSACTAEVAREATDAGARLVTHLGNAMGPLHQRAPGLLGAALADDRLSVSLIADLVHSHPVFLRMAFTAKTPRGVALVTDAVATTTQSAPPRTAGAASARSPGPPRLADGTLAGSALTMERAVSNVVRHGGVTLADAVEAASATPARLLGLDDRGALAPGRRADLVALQALADGGWGVVSVWVAGARAWTAPDQDPAERRAEP